MFVESQRAGGSGGSECFLFSNLVLLMLLGVFYGFLRDFSMGFWSFLGFPNSFLKFSTGFLWLFEWGFSLSFWCQGTAAAIICGEGRRPLGCLFGDLFLGSHLSGFCLKCFFFFNGPYLRDLKGL